MPKRSKPKTEAPEDLSLPEKQWLLAQCRKRPELRRWASVRDVQHLVDRCLAHHGAKGTLFVDWRRACWNWILKQQEIDSKPRAKYYPTERNPFDHVWREPQALPGLLEQMGAVPQREH